MTRTQALSRDLRRLLTLVERGEVGDSDLRALELQERLDDLYEEIGRLREENKVLREIMAVGK